ncbi:hypothetical protein EGCR1_04565 [Enterococcus gilvus]|uniref:YopX family protein n=1 Tax=Enterococcus gilvus TaxID=160453 RepID=UPI000DF6085F|nr:YopX family protein [Enterococcus gilvus]AXG38017.1 hypothetical protein EGCR1_04565 [Enterococcus gilvus]
MIPKFRAWDKDEKVMRIVNEIHFTIKTITCEPLKGHDNMLEMYDPICFEGHFELMQSTGLKDKNGVEIFEGDVCKIQRIPSGMKPIFVVSDYIKEKLIFSKITILGQNSYEEQGGYTGNFLEVIGNRFENPELLNLR